MPFTEEQLGYHSGALGRCLATLGLKNITKSPEEECGRKSLEEPAKEPAEKDQTEGREADDGGQKAGTGRVFRKGSVTSVKCLCLV